MLMADKFRRKLDRDGIGGVHCNCCCMYFGKHRAKLSRIVRSQVKVETEKEIKEELTE